MNNNNFTTKSFKICNKYFGTENDTLESLDTIDAVFSSVLNIIEDASDIINNVLVSPFTKLTDGLTKIECDEKAETNIISIITNTTVDSALSGRAQIDGIFGRDSQFINDSKKLLSEVFGVPVEIKEIDNYSISIFGIDPEIVVLIVLGSLCIICMIILCILYKRRKTKDQKRGINAIRNKPNDCYICHR